MNPLRKLSLLLAVALSAGLIAACGGGDDNGDSGDGDALSAEEYTQQVSDEMEAFESEFRELGAAAANPESPEAYVAAVEDVQGRLDETVGTLEAITPPSEARDVHDRLVQAFQDLSVAYGGIIDAVESEDEGQIRDAIDELQAATAAFQSEAVEIAREAEDAGVPIENLAGPEDGAGE